MTRVVYRPAAATDVFEIAAYIADDNPDRAETFVHDIRAACEQRARLPYSGRPVDAIHPNLRRFVHGSYLIYYFILPDEEGIDVVHIIHGARQHERIVQDDLTAEPT